ILSEFGQPDVCHLDAPESNICTCLCTDLRGWCQECAALAGYDYPGLLKHVFKVNAFPAIQFVYTLSIAKNFSTLPCKVMTECLLHHPGAITLQNPGNPVKFSNQRCRQPQRHLSFFAMKH